MTKRGDDELKLRLKDVEEAIRRLDTVADLATEWERRILDEQIEGLREHRAGFLRELQSRDIAYDGRTLH